MASTTKKYFTLGACLFIGCLLFNNSCNERDVPFVIDEAEIERFITQSNQGRQFFRTDSLITPDTFEVAAGAETTYVVILDSLKRQISVSADETFKYLPFSFTAGRAVRDAEALVTDKLYLRTLTITQTDTTISLLVTNLSRRGWFVKLGDDAHDYAGWLLYGFNGSFMGGGGATSSLLLIEAPGGYFGYDGAGSASQNIPFTSATGDTVGQTQYTYRLISDTTDFLKIPAGTDLAVRSNGVNASTSRYMVVSLDQTGGVETLALTRNGNGYEFATEIPVALPSGWRTVIALEVQKNDAIRCCCIPYRVWP